MSEEILTKESEEEDSSDILEESKSLVEVDLDQILEYAYDQGIEADKVDDWIAENFITEEGDEEDEEEDEEDEVEEAKTSKASVKSAEESSSKSYSSSDSCSKYSSDI